VKLYADQPARAARQGISDALALAWILLWVWLALQVHEQVLRLAGPGRELEQAGEGLERNLTSAGDRAGRVPVVGDGLREPFDAAGRAGRSLADAGRTQQDVVQDLALVLALVVLVVPLALAVGWLVRRVRWVRAAGAAQALMLSGADSSLLALRALATQPLTRLRRLPGDPMEGWRRGDPEVLDALARLELDGLGLRPARR